MPDQSKRDAQIAGGKAMTVGHKPRELLEDVLELFDLLRGSLDEKLFPAAYNLDTESLLEGFQVLVMDTEQSECPMFRNRNLLHV